MSNRVRELAEEPANSSASTNTCLAAGAHGGGGDSSDTRVRHQEKEELASWG